MSDADRVEHISLLLSEWREWEFVRCRHCGCLDQGEDTFHESACPSFAPAPTFP